MSVRSSPLLVAGAVLVGAAVAVALLAPLLAPYDPRALAGPSFQPPSARHLLGTNNIGQDVLSHLLWGARVSLLVAVGASLLTVALGLVVGVGAGVLGGTVDSAVMRVVDVALALPVLPLLILAAALAGGSITSVVVVSGLLLWPFEARVFRSQALTVRQRGFVAAARGLGGGTLYLCGRHLVPALGPLVVISVVNVAAIAVLLEAGLSFLGLGSATTPSWGRLLNDALQTPGMYTSGLWTWTVLPAGLALTATVTGFALLGMGLEPRLNPQAAATAAPA